MGQNAGEVVIQIISTKTANRFNASINARAMQFEGDLDSST